MDHYKEQLEVSDKHHVFSKSRSLQVTVSAKVRICSLQLLLVLMGSFLAHVPFFHQVSWKPVSTVCNCADITHELTPNFCPVSTRHAPALSLSWTFLYLLFFRLVTWFGLPPPTPFANAVQLLLTLKVQKHRSRHLRIPLSTQQCLYDLCVFVELVFCLSFLTPDGEFSQ